MHGSKEKSQRILEKYFELNEGENETLKYVGTVKVVVGGECMFLNAYVRKKKIQN